MLVPPLFTPHCSVYRGLTLGPDYQVLYLWGGWGYIYYSYKLCIVRKTAHLCTGGLFCCRRRPCAVLPLLCLCCRRCCAATLAYCCSESALDSLVKSEEVCVPGKTIFKVTGIDFKSSGLEKCPADSLF